MANATKTKKGASKAQAVNQAVNQALAVEEPQEAFELFNEALLTALSLGAVNVADAESMIVAAGFAITEQEHNESKPVDKKEAALAALRGFLPVQSTQAALTVSLKDIASCLGKYGKHCFAPDTDNGTSLVTHSIAKQLVETGKASLAKTLDDARAHLPQYSSTGHFNTCKRLLKEHYALNVWQGGFAISSK